MVECICLPWAARLHQSVLHIPMPSHSQPAKAVIRTEFDKSLSESKMYERLWGSNNKLGLVTNG